jgi:hypothetical protein
MNKWIAPAALLLGVLAVAAYAFSGGNDSPAMVILPADAPLPEGATSTALEAAEAPDTAGPTAEVEKAYVYEPQKVSYSGKTVSFSEIELSDAGEYIEIPLEDILEKKLVRFNYQGNKLVRMLAYVAPSGRIVTSVRVCEPCKNYEKFFIQDDVLVCGKCGTTWTLEQLNGIQGGCMAYPPDELPNIIRGKSVLIKKSDLEAWKERR